MAGSRADARDDDRAASGSFADAGAREPEASVGAGEPEASSACPFCRIARGEDRSIEILCQDSSWVAFFPLEPATPGHTLIIPRAHVPDFWALDDALTGALAAAARQLGRAIQRALAPEGMNLITSAGEAAEQTVFHVHLHVVPRWHRDGFGRIWPPDKPMTDDVKEDLADLIRVECARPPD